MLDFKNVYYLATAAAFLVKAYMKYTTLNKMKKNGYASLANLSIIQIVGFDRVCGFVSFAGGDTACGLIECLFVTFSFLTVNTSFFFSSVFFGNP